jgi:hypothetical protein
MSDKKIEYKIYKILKQPSIFMQSKPYKLSNSQLRAPLACPSIFMQGNTLESKYNSQNKHFKKT